MSDQTCVLPSCQNSVCNSKHLTCSEIHHFLLMAHRFCCLYPHNPPPPPISPHLCAFPPCSNPPLPPHDCCSRSHHLLWLHLLHQNLSRNQICKLPGCSRHVFVELLDDRPFRAHEFCGWTHCQEFIIRSAQGSVGETNGQLEPSVESLIESLKAYARNKGCPPTNVQVDEDFFDKHPWDVLNQPGVRSCWLIAKCKFNVKDKSKRELITQMGFHWKQSSKITNYNPQVSRKYLTYTKLRGRKRGGDESHETGYTMTEYMVRHPENDVEKNYCVVKLCREQSQSSGRQSAKRARQNLEGEAEISVGSNRSEPQESLMHPVADQREIIESVVANGEIGSSSESLMIDFPDSLDFYEIYGTLESLWTESTNPY